MTYYFYTKEQCPLCEDGLAAVRLLQKELGFELEVRDIYKNDEWLEKYQIRIPVMTDKDDSVIDEGNISYWSLKESVDRA
ncbi:glutaredoxin family protein [Paenalkalicoccus suaedae]|nr:glutaredoxin family protein [Paenalkalicoccus suaedae]